MKAKFIKDFPTEGGMTLTLKIPKDELSKIVSHELVDMRGKDVEIRLAGVDPIDYRGPLPSGVLARLQAIDDELQVAIRMFAPPVEEPREESFTLPTVPAVDMEAVERAKKAFYEDSAPGEMMHQTKFLKIQERENKKENEK